ncbi:solute carrier family 25 member 38 [Lanmaoa asiatica]|nr:solute carrier family 25 member 38 [Lanmaoa asiatica]
MNIFGCVSGVMTNANHAVVGQQLFSGALSGFASAVLLQPLDLLKTRVQQGDSAPGSRNTILIWRTAHEIIKRDGIVGLWRGTSASLVRNVPGVAIYFTSLTHLRSVMARSPHFSVPAVVEKGDAKSVLPKLTNQGNLLAGATARVVGGFLLNPFSSDHFAYRSLTGSLRSIARAGPSELLRGFVASSLRDAPYAGLFVLLYEAIKRESSYFVPSAHAISIHSISAAAAGGIATMVTHPFDVIKTKMQVRSEHQYHGLTSTVTRIWQQRGVVGFFDGASLRLSRKILGSMVGWAVFEGMLLFMQKP